MVDFEMPLKNGGFIKYKERMNSVIIQDSDNDIVEIDANELIKFTNTNFWKYLSKQVRKE